MNYPRLVSFIAHKNNVSYKTVDAIIKDLIETVKKSVLENGEPVNLPKFGKFLRRSVSNQRGRRIGNNIVSIPEQHKIAFKPFKDSRRVVRK